MFRGTQDVDSQLGACGGDKLAAMGMFSRVCDGFACGKTRLPVDDRAGEPVFLDLHGFNRSYDLLCGRGDGLGAMEGA